MDLEEIGFDPGNWIDLAEDGDQCRAYVRAVMILWVPSKPINYSVLLLLRRLISKLSSEVGCGEVTNPK